MEQPAEDSDEEEGGKKSKKSKKKRKEGATELLGPEALEAAMMAAGVGAAEVAKPAKKKSKVVVF